MENTSFQFFFFRVHLQEPVPSARHPFVHAQSVQVLDGLGHLQAHDEPTT